jgi:cysteine-rich repeat protein
MRVPSFTVLRVFTALCLLPAVACQEPPPDNEISAALFVSVDDKTVAVGASTTISVNSVKAGGGAGANDITASVAQVGNADIGFISLNPDVIDGTTATAPPEAGRATFHLKCEAEGEAVVTFETASGSAVVTATAKVTCFAATAGRAVRIDLGQCGALQADGASTCAAVASLTSTDNNVADIPLTISVKSALDRSTAQPAPTAATQILQKVDAPAKLATITVTTGADGTAPFFIASGTTALDVVLNAKDDEGNTVDGNLTIIEPVNKSAVTLSQTSTSVGQGATTRVTVAALNGDGTLAAGKIATITVTNGELVAAGCLAADGQATLDAAGSCAFDVTGGVPTTPTMTVEAAFTADGFSEERTARVSYEVSALGVMTLDVTPTLVTISADGTASDVVIAPLESEIVIKAKKPLQGNPDGRATSNSFTVLIPSASQSLVAFSRATVGAAGTDITAGVTPTSITLSDVTDGELHVFVKAENASALGTARIIVSATDNDAESPAVATKTQDVSVGVDRALAIQSLIFVASDPADSVIGVVGSTSRSSSIAVTFRLLNERNEPVASKNIAFDASSSAQDTVSVIGSGTTNAAGEVTTVVSAGRVAASITVTATVIEKPELSTASAAISVVGGLPNSALSSFQCDAKAAFDPFTTSCIAALADRFTNTLDKDLNVQFRAEGGNITPFSATGEAEFVFSEPGPGSADLLQWSYSSVSPTLPTSNLLAAFPGCFDRTTRSTCDLVALCESADRRVSAFCPLRPSAENPDAATCESDISPLAFDALELGGSIDTAADWHFDVFELDDATARAQFTAYVNDHRACGLPLSCLTGESAGLLADFSDDCPINPGCLDFSAATECPQDGLLDVLASVRGEEAFDDENENGDRDEGESFIDYPEPFLDKNSSCSYDSLNDLERLPANEKVRLSDIFVDGDNGEFGFGDDNLETNGEYDLNTDITLKTTIVHLAGSPQLDFGEFLGNVSACGTAGTTAVRCQQSATGSAINVTSGCTENARTAFGGGALLESCLPLASTFRDGDTVSLAFRWKDANGNCPTADFAGTPTVAIEGPAKVLSNDASYTQGQCGAVPGAINASNIERPWCEEHAEMGAPIRTFALEADCAADDVGPKTVKITFALDGTTVVRTVVVGCPVCGDNVREGDEECDDGDNTPGDGCDATCVVET